MYSILIFVILILLVIYLIQIKKNNLFESFESFESWKQPNILFYDLKSLQYDYSKPDVNKQIFERVKESKINTDETKFNSYIKRLKNLDRMTGYPVVKRELSFIELDTILIILKYKYKNTLNLDNLKPLDIKKKFLYSYTLVKDWIVEQISMMASNKHFKIKNIDNTGYKYMEDEIISYKADYKNNLEQFIFKMRLYRDNKFKNYIVYFDILFDNYNIKYYINDIVILEKQLQEKIVFGPYTDANKMSGNFDSDIDYNNKVIQNYIESKSKKKIYENDRHFCFYKQAKNKINCISPNKFDEKVGIYDSPCSYNEDCPFYNKNNNYPNNRGGCNNGYCELPVNVSLVGYKEYISTNDNKPVCYNCKKNDVCKGIQCNMCCDEQKDKSLYPNLDGPDYAFKNDFNERIKYSNYFEDKNLSPIKLIA